MNWWAELETGGYFRYDMTAKRSYYLNQIADDSRWEVETRRRLPNGIEVSLPLGIVETLDDAEAMANAHAADPKGWRPQA